MARGTRDERAAYGHYVESCGLAGEAPEGFGRWLARAGERRVKEMVELGSARPWEPACRLGYPMEQLHELMGEDLFGRFSAWMTGQGGPICDGRGEAGCGPHGFAVWEHDLDRFMGWPPRTRAAR